MKKILIPAVILILALTAFDSRAFQAGSGRATFSLTAFAQSYSGVTASIRTNHTDATTNITTVTKWKATNDPSTLRTCSACSRIPSKPISPTARN